MTQKTGFRYLYIFYSFIFLIHIINVFVGSTSVNYILGMLALIMLVISFPGASRLFKILGSLFVAIGGALYFTSGRSILDLPNLLTSNMSLLTLLAMLPWMNSVVRSGRFDRNLKNLLKANVSDLGKLYPRSSITTLILASFLNLSAASVAQDVLKDSLRSFKKKTRNAFIATASLRGYTLALLWSPLEILVAVSIFTTGADYVSVLPWLLLIALVTFVLDALWGRIRYRKYTYHQTDGSQQTNKPNVREMIKKTSHLIVSLALFLTLVIFLGNLFNLDFIFTVTLLIFPFASIWAVLMKRWRSFWTIGWKTWRMKTNTMQNFVVLFISLSLFAESISDSEFLNVIQEPVLIAADYPMIIFIIIQVIFIVMSLFGIHPVATIGILGGITSALMKVLNPISLAIVLITSSVATLTVGTYGLVVTLTAMNTGQNPYRITWRNMPFALAFGAIGSVVACFLL